MRAEKLGDLEGAIARYEAAVTANGSDAEALKALVDLYDKTGARTTTCATMERLASVAPGARSWRRCASSRRARRISRSVGRRTATTS